MNIIDITEVNFYDDPITVLTNEDNIPYVVLSQLLGNLGLTLDECTEYTSHPAVRILQVEGQPVCTLDTLTFLLAIIPYVKVGEVFREGLFKYQTECAVALRDYWLSGVAINVREVPYVFGSGFRDERSVSRPLLRDAVTDYCNKNEGVDPDQLYDRALSTCYGIINLEPKAEDEALSGATAKYLSWLETIYAKVIVHCIRWSKHPADLDAYAKEHALEHVSAIGQQWLEFADTVPRKLFTS